jgi:hypothetical protein
LFKVPTCFVYLFVLSLRSTEIINVICLYERGGVIVLLTMRSTKALYSDVIRRSVLCEMRLSQHASGYFLRLLSANTRISSPSLSPPWAGKAQSVFRLPMFRTVRGWNTVGRRDFSHPSRPALVPTQPHVQLVLGPLQGYSGRSVALTTHPHLAPRLKEELELYIYSPSGPSWPVIG